MIAVILFFVVILATAFGFIMWATNLDKREKAYKEKEQDLNNKCRTYLTHLAHLKAREDVANKKQKDADDAWQKCLEEGNRLLKKQHELEAKEAEIEAKETRLKQVSAAEVPDIIEPVEEPAKPVKKARKGGKK